MRICFIASASSVHSEKWINYFAKSGHEVYWISLNPLKVRMHDSISFYLIKGNPLFSFIRIKRLIRKINPDILHAHYVGINGIIAAFSNFHPLILSAWGSDVLIVGKSKIKGFLTRFALKRADLITCDGENIREAVINFNIDSQKIRIIYFGIDTKKYRSGLGPKSDSKTVISLRAFEPIYDLETLIKAIPIVLKKIPDVKFIIAGKGEQKQYLMNLAKSLNVFDSIRLVGQISNDKMPYLLNLADIYVSTSLSDGGLSSSTAEAMACELPVVITDSGDNKKWINGGGFVVPVENPEMLAHKIIYLLKNKDEREKFGKINREIIETRHNYYKEMAKMENIYSEEFKKK